MRVVADRHLVIERGDGVWIWDTQGNRYLDSTAALWYCLIGYGRHELAEAAEKQMRLIPSYSSFGDVTTEPTVELAEKIASISPLPDTAVFFTSGGSESVDTAAKMVRRYWNVVGKPQKRIIVTRGQGYHGMAGFGTSIGGILANTTGYGPLIEDVVVLSADCTHAFAQLLEEKADQVAAFVGEPVRGAGGVYPPPNGYWQEIERLCRKHDVLLVCDEVITGFGRLGSWFSSPQFGIEPDLIIGAKGVTSGYLPLGVVLCGPRIQEPFWHGSAGMLRHGYTYSGHATACAVGIANLDILEKEKVIEHGARMADVLRSELLPLQEHSLVREVRTIGMLAAIELSEEARRIAPNLVDQVILEARRHEVMTRNLLGQALQISPALIIEPKEIAFMAKALVESLDAVAARMPDAMVAR